MSISRDLPLAARQGTCDNDPLMCTLRVGGAFLVALGLAGCGVTNPSDLTSETFSGTVQPGVGAPANNQFLFSVGKTGEFIATITALSPDSGATVGGQYGTPTPGGCAIIGSNPLGGLNKQLFDITLPAGSYCFQVYDSLGIPRAQTFTLVLQHS